MALTQKRIYTEEDYYNSPEDIRMELIDGQIYYQAAPSRIHQTISGELYTVINNYIKSKKETCRVFAAPFAVNLSTNDEKTIVEPDISVICDRSKLTDRGCSGAPDWIVDPRNHNILVYYLGQKDFGVKTYTFQDKIKVNIYEDFVINFHELDL